MKRYNRIFISAGHGGGDSGAVANGRKEADIALEFRDLVAHYLNEMGVPFSRDGNSGYNLPLRDAVKMVKADDLAIEFHLNAAGPQASGVETLSKPKDYAFCKELCQVIADRLNTKNRGAKPENSGQHSRLAFVQAGGIICELFFITSKSDLAAYDAVKWLLAKDVAHALAKEFKQ